MLTIILDALDTDEERDKATELYNKHGDAMFWVAMRVLKNEQSAQDAVQTAFLKIIKNKEKMFSLSGSDFRRWSVTIVKNTAIDILRKDKHISDTPIDDMEFALDSGDVPLETQLVTKDEYGRLRENMKQLSEINRTILEMKYALGMSVKEIAEMMDILPKSVENQIALSKAKLRKLQKMEDK